MNKTKKQKIITTTTLTIFFISFIFAIGNLNYVNADTYGFPATDASMYNMNQAGAIIGSNYTTLFATSRETIFGISSHIKTASGTHNAYFLIYDYDFNLLATTQAKSITTTYDTSIYTLNSAITVDNNTRLKIFCVSDAAWYMSGATTNTGGAWTDSTNSYASPTLPSDASYSSASKGIALYIYTSPAGTPTPSPTPTPQLSFTQEWTTPQPINYSSFFWNITGKTYPIVGLYQEINYTMLNHVWNNTVPYVNGNYAVYYSPISNGSLGANIYDVLWNSYNGTMNLNKTGTVGNGYFYHYVKPVLYEGRYTYQLIRINGTITGTSETFSQDIIIQAYVPSMTTTLYLTGGRYINPFTMLKLSYNYLSQATYYNIKGYVTINSILGNGTGNYTLSTSYLSSNPINYAEFIGIGQTTNFSIFQVTQGNVLNGQFQFTLAPRTFSQTKVYQILVVNVTLDSGFNTIDYYSLEFDSYLSTPNTSSIDNNFAEGAGTFWLILMLVLFVPVMGVTIYVAVLTRSGSATALVFFGGTLLDIIFGVTTGLLDWWVIVIVGIFLVISAYAQWGKVTSGG